MHTLTYLGFLQPLDVGVQAQLIALGDDRQSKRVPGLACLFWLGVWVGGGWIMGGFVWYVG